MQYELFYLVGEAKEAELDAIRAEIIEMLKAEKAKVLEPEIIEKRRLAYEIKHQNRGTYVTRRFELPEVDFWADETNATKEFGIDALTKKLNLYQNILRFMIVKADELPELKERVREAKKEERPLREKKTATPKREKVVKKEEEVKEVEEKKEEAPKEEKKGGSIDEKLEEILNI